MSNHPTDTLPDTATPANVQLLPDQRWSVTSIHSHPGNRLEHYQAVGCLVQEYGHTSVSAARLLNAVATNGQPPTWPNRGGPFPLATESEFSDRQRVYTCRELTGKGQPWTLTYRADGQWWAQLPMYSHPTPCGSVLDTAHEHAMLSYADATDRARWDRDVIAPEAVHPGHVLVLSGALRMVVTTDQPYRTLTGRHAVPMVLLEHTHSINFDPTAILELATVAEWRHRWQNYLPSIFTSTNPHHLMPVREALTGRAALEDLTTS